MGALYTVSGPSFVYCFSLLKIEAYNLRSSLHEKKNNLPVNKPGLCTKTNHSLVLHEIVTSLERG